LVEEHAAETGKALATDVARLQREHGRFSVLNGAAAGRAV